MFQATRRRLALWYTAVTAVLLLLFATGVYIYVRATLIERIDDTLKHVVEVIQRSIVIETVTPDEGTYRVNVEASFRNNIDSVEDDRIDLEWFGPTGKLVWSTLCEPLDIALHPDRSGETVHLSRDRWLRQLTERVEVGRYVLGYLRVSHPWFEVTKPIRKLIIDLTLWIGAMLLGVAGIGWLLSGIAIQPVKDSYSSLKQFTADASHELRNPIAIIQTNVQMALSYPDAEPQLQQKQLRVVERLTQRLGHLVDDLLFLARSDGKLVPTKYQPVPLDALLMEVIEEQKLAARQKGIDLSLKIVDPSCELPAEEVFTLMGDWEQLARLFTNSIANAIEHSGSAKKIEVELQQFKRDRNFQLRVKVKDDGVGIPQEALPHIFDRFYRVEPYRHQERETNASTGSGLGLAIAKAIVENHHGQISVESERDRGTTFTITFPVNLVISS